MSISVIVPAYNCGKYLPDLVHSIYGGKTSLGVFEPQTLLPEEIVIADDFSTDDTKIVVEILAKTFPIRYTQLERNSGSAIASNEAIKLASGKIITRIDADDMRESFSIQKLHEVLVECPKSIVYDDVVIFGKNGKKPKVWKMEEYSFSKLLRANFFHAGIMFYKSAWEEIGGYPEEYNDGRDDWAVNIAFGIKGYCGIHVDSPGYLYRREGQNRTLRNSSAESKKRFDQKIRNTFLEYYEGRNPMACTSCGGRKSNMTTSKASPASSQPILPGSAGMTLVQYLGLNYGTEVFFGPVTGVAYQFSVKKNLRYVDNRDLTTAKNSGLLDLYDHKRKLFDVYVRAEAPQEVVASQEIVAPVAMISEPTPEIPIEIERIADQHNLSMTQPNPTFEAMEMEKAELKVSAQSGTPIEAGQVSGIGKSMISKLASSDITTWEQFIEASSSTLAKILGKTVSQIEDMKSEITS